MGRSLVKCALARGDLVTSVGRVHETSPEDMQGIHANCLGTLCDVRSRGSVSRAVEKTLEHYGRIDVVANCSGYGVIGACEATLSASARTRASIASAGTISWTKPAASASSALSSRAVKISSFSRDGPNRSR